MNKSLCAMFLQTCMTIQNMARLPCHITTAETPPNFSLFSHPLFSLCKCSASIDEFQWVPFFPCGGIQWHTFVSSADAILSECPSAAICCSATKRNGVLEGRFNLYCPISQHVPVMLWTNIMGGITFGAGCMIDKYKLLILFACFFFRAHSFFVYLVL